MCTFGATLWWSRTNTSLIMCIQNWKMNIFLQWPWTLWPITLTFEFDLDRVEMNQHAKYLGQRSKLFSSNVCVPTHKHTWTRNVINVQRDGRPAEYRWRPLFNAAKFGWRTLLECRAVTLPRRETRWNLQECPKLTKRFQPLVGRSSPYYGDMWRRYCCVTSFFRLLTHALVVKTARQSCAMVPRWWFLASCICGEPRTAHFRPAF